MWDKQKRIDGIYRWADRKRNYYDEEYQQTGSPSAMRTFQKYDDICDICVWAEQGLPENDEERRRRWHNQYEIIDRMLDLKKHEPEKVFTFKEVEEWMRRMVM